MKNGDMLKVLADFENELIPECIRRPYAWSTLDVDYDPPRVERLWMNAGDYRIYLHRIHPCEVALFHPHPWPSVIRVLSGRYEMAVGYSGDHENKDGAPPAAATLVLTAGSSYEMTHPDGWHYVRPLDGPSLSIMITGAPWKRTSPGKGIAHKPLTDRAKDDLLTTFEKFFPRKG